MEEFECPYCEEYSEFDPSGYEHYEEYEEYQCPKCEKNFEVYAQPTIDYSVCDKADCLNGGEHKWKQIVGYPEIHFRGKYRCEDCSAKKSVKTELATKEEYDNYFESLKDSNE